MEDVSVFVQSFAPPPRMYVFGAIDFASAVARMGKFMGYRVTVCDARPVFATRDRFPTADEVVVAWPDEFLKTAEVDHRTPLFRVWRDHRDLPWPDLLAFWGAPNLQVINRSAHVAKCATEVSERVSFGRSA